MPSWPRRLSPTSTLRSRRKPWPASTASSWQGSKTIEGPVFALRGAGIQLVIADSFARYFLRNAINNGFPILVCDGISGAVQTGHQLSVDLDTARITNVTTGQVLAATPLSATTLEILAAGGLVPYARRKLAHRATAR
jgi:3-isopropylmalate/(R)-2-methylmalate dehydratase small subunit